MNYNDYFDFELNSQQKEAFSAIVDFVGSNDPVFILKGSAGTGKTTLLKGLYKYLEENQFLPKLMATTGRAAKVMQTKTQKTATTIHSSIYTMVRITIGEKNTENNDTELKFVIKQNTEPWNTIFIIDEASMISDRYSAGDSELAFGSGRLLQDIFTYCDGYKIIFVGDQAQLPPVKTAFSAALNKNYITEKYGLRCREYSLTKVERHKKNSGIITNAEILKNNITNKTFKKLKIHYAGYNDIIALDNNYTLISQYLKQLKSDAAQEDNIFISLSNKVVNEVNSIVRKNKYPQESKILVPGEKLMVAVNNYKFKLLNGDLITFKRFTGWEKFHKYTGLTFTEIEFEYLSKTYTALMIKDFLLAEKPYLSQRQVKALLVNFMIRAKYKLSSFSTTDSKFLDLFNSDPYLNALKLRYAYAVTCHKAQGGEWNNVFLNIESYLHKMDKENAFRWLYTAVTRAVEKLYIAENF
jgi:ATP-dependent exoDNAse (exonuclease V) alpha subunit